MERLGLPPEIRACLFDLDGVLTETAKLHAKAWKKMFDGFLSARARSSGQPFVPFDVVRDYDLYVDGKPRDDGTSSFNFMKTCVVQKLRSATITSPASNRGSTCASRLSS